MLKFMERSIQLARLRVLLKSITKIKFRIIFTFQFIIIALCILGERIRNYLPFISERYQAYINEKKWKIGIITLIVGNQLSAILSSTGAFEIYCDDREIFSKLKSNSMPTMELIIYSINSLGYQLRN